MIEDLDLEAYLSISSKKIGIYLLDKKNLSKIIQFLYSFKIPSSALSSSASSTPLSSW